MNFERVETPHYQQKISSSLDDGKVTNSSWKFPKVFPNPECAATLVCFLLAYPRFFGTFSQRKCFPHSLEPAGSIAKTFPMQFSHQLPRVKCCF